MQSKQEVRTEVANRHANASLKFIFVVIKLNVIKVFY